VFARAKEFGCKYIFLRTPVSSQSLKWSLGIGFVPVHYFVVKQMLLMLGNLEHTVREYEFRILDYFAGQLSIILDQDRDFDALMQQTELDYSERMKVMQSLSANIAHEMRTPLSGVRASMDGIETYLPLLLEVYRKAGKENLEVPTIREDHIAALEKTPERITLMIDQANSVIDMLLMNLRDNTVDKRQFGFFSIADCIRQAMDRYPFKRNERDKVRLDLKMDFYFRGLDSLFIYVMFNLLKNALYSINSALKGDISITLVPGKGVNKVVFRDTGEGIDPAVVGKVFDGFFSTREEGTGVGLAFCRRTMRSFDGDITCDSEPGEFAEFTITLPAP
jgi:two-component system CAI-1 autoinducer sensor kinase/phosphatase CqsS